MHYSLRAEPPIATQNRDIKVAGTNREKWPAKAQPVNAVRLTGSLAIFIQGSSELCCSGGEFCGRIQVVGKSRFGRILFGLLVVATTFDAVAFAQKIESAQFGKAVSDSDQLSEVGNEFRPMDAIYLKVSLDSRPKSGSLSCKFYFGKQLITTVAADLAELAARELPEGLNAYGLFTLKPTSPFPISDDYRAEIFYNDNLLGRFDFEITTAAKSVKPRRAADRSRPVAKDTPEIIKKLLGGTAYVHAADELGNSWTGTAWLLDRKQRLLVTNDHVASSAAEDGSPIAVTSIQLVFPEYKRGRVIHDAEHYRRFSAPVRASVVYSDSRRDLAILRAESVPTDNTAEIKLASDSGSIGDSLHSLGGVPRGSEGYWIYTSGEIRAVYKRSLANGFEAQTVEANMQTNQGNSGGPVLNDAGELVAVVEGHQTNARSVSLYIDLAEVKEFLHDSVSMIDPKVASDFVRRGDHHYEAGRLEEALQDYTRALRIDPKNADAMTSRGWVFYSKGDNQTALVEFSDAIEADRMSLHAYHGRATIRSEEGDYVGAIDDLTYALTNSTDSSDSSEFYNERGVAYWRMEKLDQAQADCERAVKADPTNAWAHYNRGNVLAAEDQHQAAVPAFLKAIELDATEAEFYWSMGKSAYAIGKPESAMKLFDTAIALDATVADYLISKAKVLADANNFAAASELLAAAIAIDENDDRVINEVGLMGFELGNYPMAEAMFRQAAELALADAVCWFNVGHAQLKQHKWNDAVRSLTKSIELDDRDGDTYALRGEAYSALGKSDFAKRDFAKAKKLMPGAFDKYSTKLLQVGNRTSGQLVVHLRYRAKGTDGTQRWYPLGGGTLQFTFEPNEISHLEYAGNQIHGDQFEIWAETTESGDIYTEHRKNKLISVGSTGYLSASGAPDTELYQFVAK
ncbi:MAG TPA: hypothetical protein DDW52_29935 [Planctomycetaceae bacterium]|nr:hypothetical protein [Planctomycetaceae bacterium]